MREQLFLATRFPQEYEQHLLISSRCRIVGNWISFCLSKMFHLSSKRLLQLGGSCRLLNFAWDHLLCSQMAIPDGHRWITFILNLSLIQTICLLWLRCLHRCSRRNDFSPSHVSGRQSPDVRSLPPCVVPSVYGEVVLSTQCTNVCSPGCFEQRKLHYSVYAWVFCP